MKRFWMSWYDAEEDYRPLHDPPSEAILGWWCSGEHADGRATLVALVQADDLPSACVAVAREWPETAQPKTEWRFGDEVALTWRPADRFPLSAWMEKRVGRATRDRAKG